MITGWKRLVGFGICSALSIYFSTQHDFDAATVWTAAMVIIWGLS